MVKFGSTIQNMVLIWNLDSEGNRVFIGTMEEIATVKVQDGKVSCQKVVHDETPMIA